MKETHNEKLTALLSCLVIFALIITDFSARNAVREAMASLAHIPITCVETDKNEVALTYNITSSSNIDSIIAELGQVKATFFADGAALIYQTEDIKKLRTAGHEVGILRNDLKGKSQQEIYDIIAATIEEFSFIAEGNSDLVRFELNRYDGNAVKAIFDLGLYPVQWSTDGTIGNYSEGDIILITDDTDITTLLTKIKSDGLKPVPVGKMLIKNNYKIDLSGRMTPE